MEELPSDGANGSMGGLRIRWKILHLMIVRLRTRDEGVGRSVGLPVGWSVGRSVGRSVGWSVGRSVGLPGCRSVGRSVGVLVGRSMRGVGIY